jgi:site-specific DNA-methyltransferase (adenine-specific)
VSDIKTDSLWLMQGDCVARMKEIQDSSVDVVISDIPYGIDFAKWDVTHNNKNKALLGSSPSQSKSSLFKSRGKPKNGWSKEDSDRGKEFRDFCKSWFAELYRITKPCSPVIIFSGRQNQHHCTLAAEDSGFIFKDYIVWDKKQAPFRAQNVNKVITARGGDAFDGDYRLGCPAPVAEPILWLFKPYPIGSTITDQFLNNGLGCFESSIIKNNLLSVSSKVESKLHDTQKPTELMEILIKTFSIKSHLVLDMFMGSGTTGVACVNTGRNFIGIELDENYFEIAKKRILETNA